MFKIKLHINKPALRFYDIDNVFRYAVVRKPKRAIFLLDNELLHEKDLLKLYLLTTGDYSKYLSFYQAIHANSEEPLYKALRRPKTIFKYLENAKG